MKPSLLSCVVLQHAIEWGCGRVGVGCGAGAGWLSAVLTISQAVY